MNAREPDQVDNPSDEFDLILDRISDRIHAGEAIDLPTLMEEHPQHAARLERLVPTIQAMADLASRSDTSGADAAGSSQVTDVADGALGDFRIIREIGRGGMGIVYEAQQISLRRRVALGTTIGNSRNRIRWLEFRPLTHQLGYCRLTPMRIRQIKWSLLLQPDTYCRTIGMRSDPSDNSRASVTLQKDHHHFTSKLEWCVGKHSKGKARFRLIKYFGWKPYIIVIQGGRTGA